MSRREVAIEIFMPDEGLHTDLSRSMITPRSTPFCRNANSYYGVVQKDYGTILFHTGSGGVGTAMGAPINLLYSVDFYDTTLLEAFTHTGMYKYSAGLDAFVIDSIAYTGTFTDFWSACMHNDAMVYADGAHLVQYKLNSAATGTNMGGVTSGSYKAFAVVSFANHLNLYHTDEGGNECRKRVRWSVNGPLAYASADWSGGTSGFLDVQDVDGDILTAHPLGAGNVAVYGEGSIHIQSWVGGTSVYRFDKLIAGVQIPARRAVVSNDTVHYLLARDNIYEYHGGRDIRPIGEAIKSRYISLKNEDALDTSFLEYIRDEGELRVHIPTGTSTQPDKCFICKIVGTSTYTWWEGDTYYTVGGKLTTPSALTIGELVGNIGAQNWTFGDLVAKSGATIHLLADQSGRVVKRSKATYALSNSGTDTPQPFLFDTKDISSIKDIDPLLQDKYHLTYYMDNMSRWTKATIEAKGYGTVSMQYSVDGGIGFDPFPEGDITLTPEWETYELDLDYANPNISLRVENTGTNEVVHMRYLRVDFVPGGDVE